MDLKQMVTRYFEPSRRLIREVDNPNDAEGAEPI